MIGGGLAGLAASQALAERGMDVVVLESKLRLGGRAGSFTDAATGQVVDACQHVSMGCCTNLEHFFATVGVARFLETQKALHFVTLDGRVSRFAASRWPAPLHLAGAFLKLHTLPLADKWRIAIALRSLRRATGDPPFIDWLRLRRQSQRAIDNFWSLVLVSALNETVDRVGLKYARKVFVDGFMAQRRGFEVQVPSVPLDRLYGEEMKKWFAERRVDVRLNSGIRQLTVGNGRVVAAQLRDGERLTADRFILAVPFQRVGQLLPESLQTIEPFAGLSRLEQSPITSVHLWFDRATLPLPHAVLVGCFGQWVFNRGEVATGEHYVQVVISAARECQDMGNVAVTERVITELRDIFPAARSATLLRSRVVTEQAATFSAVPGVDAYRPVPRTPIANLFLAGDYTATGWPATMEGAVRSGYAAAEAITGDTIVRPDLR